MSETERSMILKALSALPESGKQFVLGYAAGVVAKTEAQAADVEADQNDKEPEVTSKCED